MRNLIPLAFLLASACSVQQSANDDSAANEAAPVAPLAPANDNASSVPPAIPAPPGGPAAQPAPAPPSTPDSEKSPQAAARLLERYLAAVATRDYRTAYGMWAGGGEATGMTYRQFADSFARYKVYDGNIGKAGDIEGAAGSMYIEFPVKVTGVLARGGGFVLEGPMTLRRANDVDGSTAEQRRWRIASSGLKPRP
jgi:hypothetical protein